VYVEQRQRRGDQADHEVVGVRDPEDRVPVEQDVAQGAAADRRNDADDGDTEPVQTLAARRQRAADGEDRDAEQLEDVADATALPWGSGLLH
jgi:hypothetical protein